ncbi:UNVERIFIED_ORG: DNA-directed RNA polymerase specialized sigma24 family protein [Rhodococcus erythropolis]
MATSKKSAVSARDRARNASAARLAEEQKRVKLNEDDLVSFFQADQSISTISDDLTLKIEKLRRESADKIREAESDRQRAVLALKERGETVASIATMTELSPSEVNRLLKAARAELKESDPKSEKTEDKKPVAVVESSTPDTLGSAEPISAAS